MDQTSIGRYRIVRQLGRGGMGTLFLARDPMIDRLIAIKLLRTDLDSDDVRERFEREARFAGGLKHPNIVTIFDVGDDGGHPFIAMEYIDGETVLDVIRDRRTLSFGRRLEWIEELCAGLDYAHRAGVVHRDIKPANLMINAEGTLKILDFGVARLGESEMTRTGMVIGTLNYMAPEQMESRPIDARADMFSVGAVFYELLAYRRAFPGDDARVVMHQILSGSVEPLATVCPSLDPEISSIVSRCLEKDAAKRWPDLDEVRQRVATVRRRLANDPRDADLAAASGSVETPQAGVTPASAGARRVTERQHLLQIRAGQIQKHLRHAREAYDQRDYAAVVSACREAMVLDPDEPDAVALADRAQAALERQQVEAWLEEARTEFGRGGLTAASVLVDHALAFDPTLPEAHAIKQAVHDARRRLTEENERAVRVVAEARRSFAEGNHAAALTSLAEFVPRHDLVTAALDELRLEARQIERLQKDQEPRTKNQGPAIQSVQPGRQETDVWPRPAMARRRGYIAWALAGVLGLVGGAAINRWWNVPPQTQSDTGKSPLPAVSSVAPQPPAAVEQHIQLDRGSTTSAPEGAVGDDASAQRRATKAPAGASAARAGSPEPVSGTRSAPIGEAPAANSRQALQVACDRGEVAKCYDLGMSYQTAKGGEQDHARATALFRGACESGLAQGCNALGVAYGRGFGVQPDERRAATLYQQACDGGYASGCVNAGMSYLRGRLGAQDETRAAALLQRGCDLGEGGGCASLGRLYEFGQGVQKDEARAAALYQRGCAAANASACTSFGWMYFRGVGIEKDEARAVTLFRRACDNGHAPGCNDLGVAYAEGRGVPKDESRAAELYQQACDKDSPLACVKLGFMYRRGEPVPRDEARAATLFQRGCDGGNPAGCLNLGFAYANGRGVSRDESRAVALYQRSCDAGTADACTRVATMYEQGRGVAKDAARAAAMYVRGRDLIGKGSTDAAPGAVTPATTSTGGSGQRPLPAPGDIRPAAAPLVPLRVGGSIASPAKIKDVRPDYPAAALYARVQGMVIIEVTLGADGKVAQTKILRSIPLLDGAAEDAVKQWQYAPTLVDGKAVPVVMTATLNFSLPEPKPAPAAKETGPAR